MTVSSSTFDDCAVAVSAVDTAGGEVIWEHRATAAALDQGAGVPRRPELDANRPRLVLVGLLEPLVCSLRHRSPLSP
jgi:hypothetical protein